MNCLYPLVNIQKAIENGPVEIVDFPINSMVIFHGKMLVHQRVVKNLDMGVSYNRGTPKSFILGLGLSMK